MGQFDCGNDFQFRSKSAPNRREGAGSVVGSHVLQNVRRRLKRRLAHLVHADRVPAIFARHKSVARNVSGRGVHTLRLRFSSEQ